jgi:hypothetical protein
MGMIMKLLGWRGIAGLAGCLVLGILLMLQKGETRHWKKQSGQFEQLYHNEQAAFAQTVANYRAAAEQARLADQANKARVERDQAAINERTSHDFETRLADARARAARLQQRAQGAADPGGRGSAPVPGLPAAGGKPAQAAGQDRLSPQEQLADRICGPEGYHDWDQNGPVCEKDGWTGLVYFPPNDALTATEQAIQLDELIKWVRQQHAIDVNGPSP